MDAEHTFVNGILEVPFSGRTIAPTTPQFFSLSLQL